MGAPSGSVFISYRRDDVPFAAHAVHCHLARRFDEHRIFMDVRGGIHAGSDFAERIAEAIAKCDVLLALIGERWNPQSDNGYRLDDEMDFIRLEIGSALRVGKRVIPVLVEGAHMPNATALPADLAGLVRRNAFRLSQEDFGRECDELIRQVEYALIQADGDRYKHRMRGSTKVQNLDDN